MPSPNPELREFHRIRFPISERPTFLHKDKSYPVIDVSIRGFCYSASGGPLPKPHDSIKGILRFRRGAQVKIEGTVVRIQNEEVALHLNQEIPFAVLLAEQRYLHKHYPAWS
jgi:hypothetical protein